MLAYERIPFLDGRGKKMEEETLILKVNMICFYPIKCFGKANVGLQMQKVKLDAHLQHFEDVQHCSRLEIHYHSYCYATQTHG